MLEIVLVIASSLISGLLATIVTIVVQKKSELRKSQIEIFETLMSYRYGVTLKESVNALNKIDVVFYSKDNVVQAWKDFKQETLRAGENPTKPNNIQDKQLRLLEEMAKTIGYKKINWQEIKDFYFPQGLFNQMQEESALRKAQLNNMLQPNIQPENTQLSQTDRLGLMLAMKMLETPDGVNQLIKLTEKFNEKNGEKDENIKK